MKRSPTLVYLLLWLSIGFYAVYWFLDSLRFLNGFRPVVSVAAFFLWFVCFPYMQHHINRIVEEVGVVPKSLQIGDI